MPERREATAQPETAGNPQTFSFNVGQFYTVDPSKVELEITSTHYSNHAFIQAMARDVWVDFLAFPGAYRGGKQVVSGVRVFLTYQAAQALVKALANVLDQASRRSDLERFPSVADSSQGPEGSG